MNEAQFREKLDVVLSKFFIIEREVKSLCTLSRLDYVLKCKTSEMILGLEVKAPEHFNGARAGSYAKQAGRYTEMVWDSRFNELYSIIPIFICPSLSDNFITLHKELKEDFIVKRNDRFGDIYYFPAQHALWHTRTIHHNMNGFLGTAFDIGELRKVSEDNSFAFIFRNTMVWSSWGYRNKKQYDLMIDIYKEKRNEGDIQLLSS